MTGFAFNRLMVVMNRSIPVAVALYRYALVFYYDLMYDKMRPPKMEGERLNAAEFDSNCNFIILSNNKT